MAHKGTLFLDEIAELRPDSQGKILKALEQQVITRLGGTKPIQVNCRVLFATNKELRSEAQAGRFREDLYYRIDVYRIHIPPLRERQSDIPALAAHFMRTFGQKYRKDGLMLEESAARQLMGYAWPGNIRELRNIMERLVIRCRDGLITRQQVEQAGILGSPSDAPVVVPSAGFLNSGEPAGGSGWTEPAPRSDALESSAAGWEPPPLAGDDRDGGDPKVSSAALRLPEGGVDLEQVERDLVIQALERADWNQKDAAALLGISVDRMNSRVKKFGLRHSKWRVNK
jgi:transcriptional regulator with GAF, ATPase, and Fis domain